MYSCNCFLRSWEAASSSSPAHLVLAASTFVLAMLLLIVSKFTEFGQEGAELHAGSYIWLLSTGPCTWCPNVQLEHGVFKTHIHMWVIPCQINTKKYLTLTDLDETWFLHSVC